MGETRSRVADLTALLTRTRVIGLVLYHRTVLPTRLCARVYDVAEWRDRRVVDPMVRFKHGV